MGLWWLRGSRGSEACGFVCLPHDSDTNLISRLPWLVLADTRFNEMTFITLLEPLTQQGPSNVS
jgi:hypothetical protein